MMQTQKGEFYLGEIIESGEPIIYDADDLTTHGVIVGMTGSGKTGLGIDLIEEALLNGIPCLVIDPKGDMGNLALVFPEQSPEDFEPWVDPAEAERADMSAEELAKETAETWKSGLKGSGIGLDRLRRLGDSSEVTVYTPGSTAGRPIDVLGSMRAPAVDWESEAETARDEIQALVSSLLLLSGIESDPVSGPEHILLANIVEASWRQGSDLDLATLVAQVPKPPFRKLGVFEVDTFIPEKDRMELALALNGLLASPSFAPWMEGDPLDFETLLGHDKPTKAAVIYLAHLDEAERQFVVTLLLSKLVTAMRSVPGTSQLRTLIYMDEVFGFVPPIAAPPSKKPILTILKTARAHGVGMVLATQNPMDLDYKAMSNAGTWMVGRLQTENDKKRILEALDSVGGDTDLADIDRMVSSLDKRQFLLHSTRRDEPVVFATRWAMSYLAGPMTRQQISRLFPDKVDEADRAAAGKATAVALPAADPAPSPEADMSDVVTVPPPVADGVAVGFLDPGAPWAVEIGADPAGQAHRAGAALSARLVYDDRRAGVNHEEAFEAVVFPLDELVEPDQVIAVDHDRRDFNDDPPPDANFLIPETPIDTKTFWRSLRSQVKTHLVANRPLRVLRNPELGIYSRVGEDEKQFRARAEETAQAAADEAIAKLREKYRSRIDRVQDRIAKLETDLVALEGEVAARKQSEVLSGAGELLGTLLRGRARSNPLGRAATRRMATRKAEARLEASYDKLGAEERELIELEDEMAAEIAAITDEHDAKADATEEVDIPLEKTDIELAQIRLVWIPVSGNERTGDLV